MGVACIFATCMTENRVCKNREWKIGSLGQSPLIKTNSDILHPQLYGDMDYINCGAKIVDQKLRCGSKLSLPVSVSKPKHHHLLWLYKATMNCGIPLRKFVMTPGCHLASVFFINLEPMLKFQILTSKGPGKWATSHIHIVFSRPVLRLKPPGYYSKWVAFSSFLWSTYSHKQAAGNASNRSFILMFSFSWLSSADTIMKMILNTVRTNVKEVSYNCFRIKSCTSWKSFTYQHPHQRACKLVLLAFLGVLELFFVFCLFWGLL